MNAEDITQPVATSMSKKTRDDHSWFVIFDFLPPRLWSVIKEWCADNLPDDPFPTVTWHGNGIVEFANEDDALMCFLAFRGTPPEVVHF